MALNDSPPEDKNLSEIMEPVKQNLFFEGFLRKRKDTMKFTWAKYWFKLQNTTLYFYNKRDSQPSWSPLSPKEDSLRGQYYMNSVQSVRCVTSTDANFSFEIVMKNGKRKLLSAESEDLRDVWIKLLWKSMQLPGPGRHNSSCTWYDIPELVQRGDLASVDSEQGSLSPDSTGRDDVFEQPQEPEHTEEVNYSGEYDFPNSLRAVQQVHIGTESESSSDSELYDVPKRQADIAAPPSGEKATSHVKDGPSACNIVQEKSVKCDETDIKSDSVNYDNVDPVQEQQYVSMDQLDLYDSPTPQTLEKDVSGPPTDTDNLYSNLPLPDHPIN
ncbi:uncharacterized protein LOC142160551 isoform X2 [Mixophyes fleayi]|uniref:uncharacterized protein LOC142160551 isoform X2 n=1 Tax=Mixophyes fleayi TaxID=3061075 RepID=UPI003F4E18AA